MITTISVARLLGLYVSGLTRRHTDTKNVTYLYIFLSLYSLGTHGRGRSNVIGLSINAWEHGNLYRLGGPQKLLVNVFAGLNSKLKCMPKYHGPRTRIPYYIIIIIIFISY